MAEAMIQAAVLVGALLLASKIGEEAAERLGYPGFAGSIIAGLVLSNAMLGLVEPKDLEPALLLFVIGINFTLFLAGVEELSNPTLLKPTRRDFAAAAVFFTLPLIATSLTAVYIFGLDIEAAFALGTTLALVSAGPLTKILLARERFGEREASILRTGLIVEVGGLVVFNALVQGFSVVKLAETLVFVLIVYMFGRRYLDEVLLFIERHMHVREAPFAIVVALVTMAGYLAEMLGFNAAVTALLLGVFLSEYMDARPFYLERVKAFTYGFLEPLFFIGIGVYATRPSPASLAYAAVLFAASAAPKVLAARLAGYTPRDGILFLAKGGVDAALLLALLDNGAIGDEVYTASLLALITSTILSSTIYRVRERKPDILRRRIGEIALDMDIVSESASAEYAAKLVARKGAAVVVDRYMRPIGYVLAEDFVEVNPELLKKIPVRFFMRTEVTVVPEDTYIADMLGNPALIREPIIAIVNKEGTIKGTITPRKLLTLTLGASATEKTVERSERLHEQGLAE